MPLSFTFRSGSLGRDMAIKLSSKEEPSTGTKQAPREGVAKAGVFARDAKLASPSPSPSTARCSTPENSDKDDVIPLLRAHVSKFATRDNLRGAQVSAVTFVYFVLTALAPWLLTSRLSAAADILGLSPAVRSVNTALLWASWGILRAAAYVRSFMLVS